MVDVQQCVSTNDVIKCRTNALRSSFQGQTQRLFIYFLYIFLGSTSDDCRFDLYLDFIPWKRATFERRKKYHNLVTSKAQHNQIIKCIECYLLFKVKMLTLNVFLCYFDGQGRRTINEKATIRFFSFDNWQKRNIEIIWASQKNGAINKKKQFSSHK